MAHFEIKNLSFSYPASKNGSALKAINLSIERGEYIAAVSYTHLDVYKRQVYKSGTVSQQP